jgi:hypothetical protein
MTQEALQTSQEGQTQGAPQSGSDQVVAPAGDAQPETENQPVKTYSQEEYDARERVHVDARANTDRQLSQARQMVAENALRQQIANAEDGYAAQDRQAVNDGDMNEGQLEQRRQQRQSGYQDFVANQYAQANDRASLDRLKAEGEGTARLIVAQNLASEHGVDMVTLFKDRTLKTGEAMEVKAQKLALEKERAELKGTETFDSGQRGAPSTVIANMSPQEKIAYGVAHPPKRSR